MVNITDNVTYLNFSKLSEFNESVPVFEFTDFETIQTGIFAVFGSYPILQWFLTFVVIISLFVLLRKLPFLDLSEVQIFALVCFVGMSLNTILLVMDVFTITQPFQVVTLLWLGSVISIIAKKKT